MRQERELYVAVIHWDADHKSPTVGPFWGITQLNRWATEFRRECEVVKGQTYPKITRHILRSPDHVMSWANPRRGRSA